MYTSSPFESILISTFVLSTRYASDSTPEISISDTTTIGIFGVKVIAALSMRYLDTGYLPMCGCMIRLESAQAHILTSAYKE